MTAHAGSRTIEDILPLTALQEGLLFHAAYDANGPDLYVVQAALHLEGRVDEARLQAAAAAVVRRHPALRAAFVSERLQQPVQTIVKDVPLAWTRIDWRDLTPAMQDEQWSRLLAEDRSRRMKLAEPPLWRFALTRLSETRHRLLFTFHHVLMDGWSVPLVIRDLMSLYAAAGDGSRLPAIAPYREYFRWLAAQDRGAAKAAWAVELTDVDQPTRLAPPRSDGPPSVVPDRLRVELSPSLADALTKQARACGVTVNTLMQAVWAVLLSRLTGTHDVVYGTTVTVRPPEIARIDRTAGLLINSVPRRARLAGSDTLRGLCAQLHARQAALVAHEHFSLAEIQRDAAQGELFDTLFVFESYPWQRDDRPAPDQELRLAGVDISSATHYPLTLLVVPRDGLRLLFDYRPDVFERATVENLATCFERLLHEAAADTDRPIGRIALTTSDERDRMIDGWNQSDVVDSPAVPGLIDAQARRAPDAPAVTCALETLSYGELKRRSDRLAQMLADMGIGADDVVAVAVPRSVELIVALLGVLKAGAAYLPIDHDHPYERVQMLLDDVAAVCVVTTRAVEDRMPPRVRRIVLGRAGADGIAPAGGEHDARDLPPAHKQSAAYVMYTSGSTGKPKGVVISHGSLSAFARSVTEWLTFRADDRHVAITTATFDMSVYEFFVPLCAGAEVVVATTAEVLDPAAMAALIRARRATSVQATPSYWEWVLREDAAALHGVRVIAGGEPVSTALAAALMNAGAVVFNGYGPTETTVYASVHAVTERDISGRGPQTVSIGRRVASCRLYVLDQCLQPVPIGVTGQLYIGGEAVARGYLKRPGLTAERFVPDPYGEPGRTMYRTGDLVRWREGGLLDFVGRADQQVKIRGFRIEPGEVEAALLRQPGVAQAVVVACDGGRGDKHLVGYVVPHRGAAPEPRELRRALENSLPEHLVPSLVVIVDSLPTTSSGKVDRRALPKPDLSLPARRRAPSTPEEQLLCTLCADVLGVAEVYLDDSFFELGGHSLLASRLVNRIRTAFGVDVEIRNVFETDMVGDLLEQISASTSAR